MVNGEKVDAMDHFYTNQYVFDLQFSWLKYLNLNKAKTYYDEKHSSGNHVPW